MPKLYLDMCALKRPYDRQDDQRVLVESVALDSLVSAMEEGKVEIVSSADEGARDAETYACQDGRPLGDGSCSEGGRTSMRTTEQLHADGWKALIKELGISDALRYRILFQPGTGDYVRERRELFDRMSLDDWLRELAQWENNSKKR